MKIDKLVIDFIKRDKNIKKIRTGQTGLKENKTSIILEEDLPPSFESPSYLMISDLKNILQEKLNVDFFTKLC